MGELILHIGTTKTGSSALQNFLFKNREKLAEQGVCYPVFTQQPGPTWERNGVVLDQICCALARRQDPRYFVCDLEENQTRLTKALASPNRVLLTDEDFSYSAGLLLAGSRSPELYWNTLAQVLSEAGTQDITVVVYLRRQDDWVTSRWRQEVKTGRFEQSLEAFCSRPEVRYAMNYAGMLEEAEASFGDSVKIVVRRYDRTSFVGGDIYRDFCKAACISWDEEYLIPEHEVNPSISYDVAEALRPFADAAPPNTPLRRKVLLPLAIDLSRQHPDALGTTPYDEEATRELLKPHLEGNREISERYLGGEPLFSTEYGRRPVWVPNKNRIAAYRTAFEKAIRKHRQPSRLGSAAHPLVHRLSEGAKRPLRAIQNRAIGPDCEQKGRLR